MTRVLRTPLILLGFACLALLLGISQGAIAAPGDILFSDDFERSNLAPIWARSNNQRAGISTQTANSGTRSLFTCCGAVDVTSDPINLSAVPAAELSMWIHVGDDTISEFPDSAGEDLLIQYLDNTSTWVTLEQIIGGTGGVEATGDIYSRTYTLPTTALHANFRIRISQNGGSGTNWDYYHVDDVVVTEIAPPLPFGFGGCDDFESGLINWTVNSLGGAAAIAPGVDTVNSPTNALYLANGRVYVTSIAIDTSTAISPTLSLWVRRGQDGLDGFSEDPDNNEDLQIQYLDSSNTWVTLDTLPGGVNFGEVFNLSYTLPASAIHTNFRVRLYQTNGSGAGWDYWHVDDICVTEPPPTPVCDTFLDTFSTVSYANNDGTVNWAGNWNETGDNGSPSNGTIRINNNRLQFAGNGTGGSPALGGPSVERSADLSTYTTATLTFDYSETGNWEPSDNFDVYASNNGGTSWTLLHNFNNDQGATVQTLSVDVTGYVSSNFRLAFVEGANRSNEIFYIDNVQVEACAPPAVSLDHFVITHDTFGINCVPEPITVTAFDGSNVVLTNYSGTITLDTQSGTGTWSLASGNGVFNDATANDGLATYQFDPADNGVATFNLSYLVGTSPVDIDVNDGAITDDDSEGTLAFSPSGFTITANPLFNPATLPDNIGTQTAATDFAMYITAYGQTPTDSVCGIIESYTGNKDLKFWATYDNPGSGTQQVRINTNTISTNGDATTAETNSSAHTVAFNAGQAQVTANYPDVGLITINMKDDTVGDPNLPNGIRGGTNGFVVKPHHFAIDSIRCTDASNTANPAASDATGNVFCIAGQSFTTTITSINAAGNVTPNFGQESPAERVKLSNAANPDATGLATLVAPAGGNNAILGTPVWQANTAYAVNQMVQNSGVVYQASSGGTSGTTFGTGSVTWTNLGSPLNPAAGIYNTSGAFTNGVATGTYAWPEVGIINFTARVLDADYLGAGDVIGNSSGNVGRFIPARLFFSPNVPMLANTCTAGVTPFAYLGQDFDFTTSPIITVTAQNTSGGFTRNYGGSFWKLHPGSELSNRSYSNAAVTAATFTDTIGGAATLAGDSDFNATPPTLAIIGDTFNYSRPAAPESAFAALVDLDLTAADLTDSDGVCFDSANAICNTGDGLGTAAGLTISNITGANLRYGIGIATDTVESNTAIGTTLTLPITAQYIDGGGNVITNTDDMCSVISYTKADTGITTSAVPASPMTFSNGSADLTVTLNSDTGGDIGGYSIFTLAWPAWLPGPTTAAAIFGAVPSDNNYLYWNENR